MANIEALAQLHKLDFSLQMHRGFEIHSHWFKGMWVSRVGYPYGTGAVICKIPDAKSWLYARGCIDEYIGVQAS